MEAGFIPVSNNTSPFAQTHKDILLTLYKHKKKLLSI